MSRVRGSRRRGATLLELLVALPLAMLAAAVAAMLLVQLSRTVRAQSATIGNARELRHARLTLTADLEPLNGRQLATVHDTLLEFEGQLGVLRLCITPTSRQLVTAGIAGAGDLWVATIREGDVVRGWRASPEPAVAPSSVLLPVTGPPTVLTRDGCGADRTVLVPRWQVPVRDSLQGVVPAHVSIHRRVRYRHYRSASAWWLGRQTFDGGRWDGLQPVAGPLLGIAEQGMRAEARDASGTLVHIRPGIADSVRARAVMLSVTLRMARRFRQPWAPTTDTIGVRIPLRASETAWRP